MEHIDYYSEKKWCGQCGRYVRYLMSVQHSFCAECGSKVGLFSKEDWKKFNEDVDKRKYWAS
jgi:DNA-directed RNA polymerase subunit RPC12/RpoP